MEIFVHRVTSPSGVLYEEGLHNGDPLFPCPQFWTYPQVVGSHSGVLHEEGLRCAMEILTFLVHSSRPSLR